MTQQGKFIVFEGIDGSGKSTQMKHLSETLQLLGYQVYNTFEPTDNVIGTMIRTILRGKEKADQKTIALLFAADRMHHLMNETEGILQKLRQGFIVLSDRFYFSSYAYHSVYMDMEWVIEINKRSAELRRPDMNIFIDVKPDTAMQRIRKNRNEIEMYETLEMLSAVKNNYEIAFQLLNNQERCVSIDGNHDFESTAAAILQEVRKIL